MRERHEIPKAARHRQTAAEIPSVVSFSINDSLTAAAPPLCRGTAAIARSPQIHRIRFGYHRSSSGNTNQTVAPVSFHQT